MNTWDMLCKDFSVCLAGIQYTDDSGRLLSSEDGFARFVELGWGVRREGGQIFFVGNGASSSMSSHFATDVGKNAGIRTQVFTDAALLTAIGNDMSFEEIYAEPLRRHARENDVLVAVSSSGHSPNIIAAARAARQAGCRVLTLSAMSPDNALRRLGELNIYVPAHSYCLAETAHSLILHHWADMLISRSQSLSGANPCAENPEVRHG